MKRPAASSRARIHPSPGAATPASAGWLTRQQRGGPGERRGRLHEQPAARKLGLRRGDGLLGDLDDAPAARAHGGEDLGAAGRSRDRDALRHGLGRPRSARGRVEPGRPRPGERRAAIALHGDQRRQAVDQARGLQLAKASRGAEQQRAVADGEDQRVGDPRRAAPTARTHTSWCPGGSTGHRCARRTSRRCAPTASIAAWVVAVRSPGTSCSAAP